MKHIEAFDTNDVMDALDEGTVIETKPWRHGTRNTTLFTHLGKHWTAVIEIHSNEGWQVGSSIMATEVKSVMKSVEIWEPVEIDDQEIDNEQA